MKIKIETWNGNNIRFVEKKPGDWWAVASDIAKALTYRDAYTMARSIEDQDKGTHRVCTPSGDQDMLIISEEGIYDAILTAAKNLRNKEMREKAKQFKRWVFGVIKAMREISGLEGFQIFRMLDKEHQREAMRKLNDRLDNPVRINFIRANTITNTAVSRKYGYPKMIKKGQMTPEMLVDRQPILDDATELEAVKAKYNLSLSVSDIIYEKYCS